MTAEKPVIFVVEDEAAALLAPAEARRVHPIGTAEPDIRFAVERIGELWAQARARGIERRTLRFPLQKATMDGFVKAFEGVGAAAGKAQYSIRAMLDVLEHRTGRNPRRSHRRARQPRALRPIPATVPPGLSRVDSARARSARSALLRSRRRAIRHNRALPRPRARITITAPEVTWGDPKNRPRDDRTDALLWGLTATSRKD